MDRELYQNILIDSLESKVRVAEAKRQSEVWIKVDVLKDILEVLKRKDLSIMINDLEELKELVWTDDSWYELGYNSGIDRVIGLIKESLCRKN